MRVSERSDILRFLDPINKFEELQKFVDAKGDYDPQFIYDEKHIPLLKKVLEYIHILKSRTLKLKTKNTLKDLMVRKCEELEVKFQLLQAYYKQDADMIEKYNIELFWPLHEENIIWYKKKVKQLEANYALTLSSLTPKDQNLDQYINKKQVIILIKYHLDRIGITKYKLKFWKYGTTNMQVSIGPVPAIYINQKTSYSLYDTCVSILHEIYGHLARYSNGKKSSIHILQWWTSYYLTTEEGVAVFSAARLEGLAKTLNKLRENYQILPQAAKLNRSQLAQYLESQWRKNLEHMYRSILRLKRGLKDTGKTWAGIIFLKDKVYLDGYCQVIDYLHQWGKRDDLLIGRSDIISLTKILSKKST